jgi:hypothetical protein
VRTIHVVAFTLALIALLFNPSTVHAQVTGTISGYVQDQGAGMVPGATVSAELAGQQLVRSTQTNESGFFDLQALPRGTYTVKVEITGFQTHIQRNVELTAGANVRLDFSLAVGGVTEEVLVSGQATMVESRNATQSNLIDDQRVQDLPMNGRNVVALAGTYAGVTSIRANQDTSDGRQGPIMSVNGGNTNHNLFTLNGSVFTHFNQTTGFNPPPPDAIEEIRIQTHNFSAEYGHTAGSQISIVTKAGSNSFHSRAKHREFGFPFEMEVLPYFLPDAEERELRPRGEGHRPHPRPYFLFVGRLERIKGLDEVIPLFRRIRGADLVIAGAGEAEERWKALAQGQDNVRFLGRVPNDELEAYYRGCEALIVPSICFETFGIILIEAFRQGAPVIARRLGPFPEIVESSGGGELFSGPDELVAAVEGLLRSRERRDAFARAGFRAFQERWCESAVIPRYLELVELARERRARRLPGDRIRSAN